MKPGMSTAQNNYQKHFGEIGTKIDEKYPQFAPTPPDSYRKGGVFERNT
jgi:hypothetical protein